MTRHALAALLSVLALCASDGAERKITLKEQLGLRWSDEIVSYPFDAPKGACVPASIQVEGSAGHVAAQLSDIEFWPGGEFVKTARLSFLVSQLDPQSTQTFTLRYGVEATPPVKSDLRIVRKTTLAELHTARFGARLLLGEKTYDPPAAPEKVPAPVIAMRLADGSWFGGGAMFGGSPIVSYKAELLDRGPAFARARSVYTYADGNTLRVTTRLDAASGGLRFETEVADDRPGDGWELKLSPGLPALTLYFPKEAAGKQGGAEAVEKTGWLRRPIAKYPAGTVTKLTPWGDWWDEFTQPDIYLEFAGGKRELVIVRREAGRWVEPVEGGEAPFGHFSRKTVPLVKGSDGSLAMRVNNAAGVRAWSVSENDAPREKLALYLQLKGPASGPMLDLDSVKDMVLDWPGARDKHPRLLMDAAEVAAAAAANPGAWGALSNEHALDTLEATLARFGEFDLMRKVGILAGYYDANIDSERVSPEQRRLLRARMAYLAYYAASPANWSPARGYRSGNPNMTIAHTLNQGALACLLRDHPMAEQWAELPTRSMRRWIDETLDEDGYWNESSHYARVSTSKLMFFAIAAQRAGLGDFLSDPKFKKMGMLYERLLTPPDPQRELPARRVKGEPEGPGIFPRVSAPHGRGERGDRWGMGGLLAKAYRKRDSAYSAVMQWSWQGSGWTHIMGEGIGGLERLYADKTLPAKAPDWGSERIDRLGYLLRDGTGTEHENFLLFVSQFASNPDGEIWPSETGAITRWFARGVPISSQFNGYPYDNLHAMMLNRVTPAAGHQPGVPEPPTGFTGSATQESFAALPRLDYAAASFELTGSWSRVFSLPDAAPAFPKPAKAGDLPMQWRRQVMVVKDDAPDGVGYLVLRDGVRGGQPSQWHFWTLSEKVGTPAETADRDRFLSDAPGDKCVGARVLKGDRLTALGQFGMDLETYIASPVGTPRHTLRYGAQVQAADVPRFSDYQDLLQLTLPGDGEYFVALFPRRPEEKVPSFGKSADGKIITVRGEWGADFVFLSEEPADSYVGAISFTGTAGSVQDRKSGLVLALGAAGTVSSESHTLSAPFGASMRVTEDGLIIGLSDGHPGGELEFTAPGSWRLKSGRGVTLTNEADGGAEILVPAGLRSVQLAPVAR